MFIFDKNSHENCLGVDKKIKVNSFCSVFRRHLSKYKRLKTICKNILFLISFQEFLIYLT